MFGETVRLSRRSFMLGSGAVGLSTPLTTSKRATAATRDEGVSLPLEVVPHVTTSYIFDPQYASVLPYAELFAVEVSGDAAALTGSVIEVDFDSRVASPVDGGSVLRAGRQMLHLPVTVSGSADSGTLTIPLPTLEGSTTGVHENVTVGIPLNRTARFPNDAVDGPRASVIRIRNRSDRVTNEMTVLADPPAPVTGSVWGASVAVVWDDIALRGDHSAGRYSIPAFVRVDSIGPGAVPAGTQIVVDVDAALVRLVVDQVFAGDDPLDVLEVDQTVTTNGGARTTALTLRDPLPARSSLSIALSAVATPSVAELRDLNFARVSVTGSIPSNPLQRVTGSEAASPVSDSGRPRADSAFTSTI